MNKFSLLSIGLLAFAANSFAQDVIITRDAKKYEANVTEIGVFVVKYKLTAEENGPTYVLPKDKIAAITYQNGRVETFFDGTTLSSDSATIAANNAPDTSGLVFPPKRDSLLPPPPPPVKVVVVDRTPVEPDNVISDDEYETYKFADNVKGLRFKLDVAPLFGGTEYFYGYSYKRRHYDDSKSYSDSSHSVNPGLEGSISVGYQFNPVVYLGVGFDVMTLDKFDWLALSEFVDLNIHCLRYSRTAPLFGLRVGLTSMVEPYDRTGYYAEPYVGINHRFTPKISLGAAIGYRASTFEDDERNFRYNDRYYDSVAFDSFFAKLFFVF